MCSTMPRYAPVLAWLAKHYRRLEAPAESARLLVELAAQRSSVRATSLAS